MIVSLVTMIATLTSCSSTQSAKSSFEAKALLRKNSKTVDAIFQDELNRLTEIAKSETAQSGDWQKIKPLLLKGKSQTIEALYCYILPDGSYYTDQKNKVKANLKDRPYFPDLLSGRPVKGALLVGKTSGKKSIFVAVPIVKKGKVVGMFATAFYTLSLWYHLEKTLDLPGDVDFFALANSGVTLFDLKDKKLMFDEILKRQYSPFVLAMKTIMRTPEGTVDYTWEGVKKNAYYQSSAFGKWKYVISVPVTTEQAK